MVPTSLYRFIWQISRRQQIQICLLTLFIAPLTAAPLELQRRIVNTAIGQHSLQTLFWLAAAYLGVLLVQGGLKYAMNVIKGLVLEEITRALRLRMVTMLSAISRLAAKKRQKAPDEGTIVSIIAAESEDVGSFASDSLAVPLLQGATIVFIVGYLVWVQPLVAALAVAIYLPQPALVWVFQNQINELSRHKISYTRRLGRKAAKSLHLDAPVPDEFGEQEHSLIDQIFQIRLAIYRRKYFLTFLGNFLDALGPLAVLLLGGVFVLQGRTDVATLVVFISGFQRLADPWDTLINFYRTFSNARISYRLVADVLLHRGIANLRLAEPIPGSVP